MQQNITYCNSGQMSAVTIQHTETEVWPTPASKLRKQLQTSLAGHK